MGTAMYFVRHGESTANTTRVIANRTTDYAPLTEKGRQQARELLNTLQSQGGITAIYTSPLMRAKETAEILAAGLGADLHVADALREPCCGMLEGRGDEEAWRHHATQEEEWQCGNHAYRIPGGESFRDVEKRFRPFIEKITSEAEETAGNTLIVSHGSILMNMLPRAFSNIDPDFARANPLGNCDVIIASCQGSNLKCVEWCGLTLEST